MFLNAGLEVLSLHRPLRAPEAVRSGFAASTDVSSPRLFLERVISCLCEQTP